MSFIGGIKEKLLFSPDEENGVMSINEAYKKCKEELIKKYEEMKNVNILITGKTGVGKSSLINAVIGKKAAKTGKGRPVTDSSTMYCYEYKGIPMRIFDTKGLELSEKAQKDVKTDISNLNNNPDTKIHIIWYCINTSANRYEQFELDWIKHLSEEYDIPVIVVLTQTINENDGYELKKEIAKEKVVGDKDYIIPVLAMDKEIKINNSLTLVRSFGVDKLCNITCDALIDSDLKDSFAASQCDIDLKVKRAQKWLRRFVASSFGTGFMPIPCSDAPLLIANETGMLIKLTTIFGLDIDKALIANAISAIIGCSAAAIAGKTIVTNILKFIPGAGTIVGGLISGTTAATLTGALGEAYIIVLTQVAKGEISVKDLKKQLLKQFEITGKSYKHKKTESTAKEEKLVGFKD